MSESPYWLDLFTKHGLPVLMLGLIAIAIVHVWRFVTTQLIVPFRDKTLKRMEDFFNRLDASIDRMEGHQSKALERAEDHEDLLEKIHTGVLETLESCDRMEQHLDTQGRPRHRRHRVQPPPPQPPNHPGPASGPT